MIMVEHEAIFHQNGHSPHSAGQLLLVSVSHHHAPVELREKLAFDRERKGMLLDDLARITGEAVAITTCNRTELYLSSDRASNAIISSVLETLARHGGIDADALGNVSRVEAGEDTVKHLFAVASGIDSAILGEPQILGQVRDALNEARKHRTTGPVLERLFQRALATGKRARSRTRIGNGAGSISHAAVQLAREAIGDLSDKRALTVGIGEMGCLVARNLVAHGVGAVTICNRTLARAEQVAEQFQGRALPWDRLPDAIHSADIVITATGADDYVLTTEHFTNGWTREIGDDLLVIDISVPRNVEPAVGELPNVHLYGIDDLQAVQSRGMQQRAAEIPKVRAIIDEEAATFMHWYRGRQLAPTIRDLYRHADALKEQEIERVLRRLGHLSERDKEAVRALAHGLSRKLLHTPVIRLKESDNAETHAQALAELFGIAPE
jgi:glutamyl-tRNA reductase